ncbi:FtsK/SpoIIIE domain-containing protein [Alicyclobacillus tolerans]|uniref:FtsK/SpoIIIE domain-containing protein n=1 Tax=Alicyclobacillus tolerans TaxID=90970 RepID=UPI003B7F86AB
MLQRPTRKHYILADAFLLFTLYALNRLFLPQAPLWILFSDFWILLFRFGPTYWDWTREENPWFLALWSWFRQKDAMIQAYEAIQKPIQKEAFRPLERLGPLHWEGDSLVGLYRLPPGESFTSLQNMTDVLSSQSRKNVFVSAADNPGDVWIEIVKSLPSQVFLSSAYEEISRTSSPQWWLGKGNRGWVYTSLSEYPHLLIAGTTGGGKTNLMKVLAESLYAQPFPCQVTLVDLKGGADYRPLRSKVSAILRDVEALHAHLTQEILLLRQREQEAWEQGTVNFEPHVTLIDEFATITTAATMKHDKTSAEQAKEILSLIQTILQKGRSLGIHLAIATQRPDAETIPGILRANIDCMVAFHVTSAVQSGVILGAGEDAAFRLPAIKGRAVLSRGGKLQTFQTFHYEEL